MDMGGPLLLRTGPVSAVVYPGAGGRLGQLDLGDGPILRGPAPDLDWANWGCYPLLPWSNRIPDGHLRFGPIDGHLPVNWPDGSAIHGLAAAAPWTVVRASRRTADLEIEVEAGPYAVVGRQSFIVRLDGLLLSLEASNVGDQPVPMGLGIHPWFCGGRVQVPAQERWPGEPLPAGPPVPVAGRYDLRSGRVPRPMDACYTSLVGDLVEVPGARLHWSGPVTQIVVYSGEPGWVCVEPVTMANNGFALAEQGVAGHGVSIVGPGGSIQVRYRFSALRGSGSSASPTVRHRSAVSVVLTVSTH
jgi:aldose 1-epimerase